MAHPKKRKTPKSPKRRSSRRRDYSAMAEEAAYQARHEGGFAGLGFLGTGTLLPMAVGAGLVWWLLRGRKGASSSSVSSASSSAGTIASGGYVSTGDQHLPGQNADSSYGMPWATVRACIENALKAQGLATIASSDDRTYVENAVRLHPGINAGCIMFQ